MFSLLTRKIVRTTQYPVIKKTLYYDHNKYTKFRELVIEHSKNAEKIGWSSTIDQDFFLPRHFDIDNEDGLKMMLLPIFKTVLFKYGYNRELCYLIIEMEPHMLDYVPGNHFLDCVKMLANNGDKYCDVIMKMNSNVVSLFFEFCDNNTKRQLLSGHQSYNMNNYDIFLSVIISGKKLKDIFGGNSFVSMDSDYGVIQIFWRNKSDKMCDVQISDNEIIYIVRGKYMFVRINRVKCDLLITE